MPTLISQAFANAGNVTVIPPSDVNGYVAFNTGYTSDYEIDLASGNPNAKAVERTALNYMLNIITDNLMFIQDHGAQQFFSGKTSGYPKNAIVVKNSGTDVAPDWRIFQSVIENNANALPANGENAFWQELTVPSISRQYLAQPLGGDQFNQKVTRGLQSVAIDFNTILVNTTIVISTNAVATACNNLPNAVGRLKRCGKLEVICWDSGPAGTILFAIQRYTNIEGYTFTRWYAGGTFSTWTQDVKVADIQTGIATLATSTGSTLLSLSLSAGYDWPPSKGARLVVVNSVDNTGPVTISIGGNSANLLGYDNAPLPASSIKSQMPFEMEYDGSAWRLLNALGTPQIGVDATQPQHFVTKRQLDQVASRILSFNDIFDIGTTMFRANSVDPNVRLYPQVWLRLPDDMVIRTTNSTHTALLQGGADSVTMTAAMLIGHSHSISLTTDTSGPWNNLTDVSGVHSHTGVTDNAGAHTHTIDGNGDHMHGAPVEQASGTPTYAPGMRGAQWGGGRRDINTNAGTTTNGFHSHTMQISGTHAHNLLINQSTSHQHAYTLPSHNHNLNGNTGSTGSATPSPIATLPRYVTLNGWYRLS